MPKIDFSTSNTCIGMHRSSECDKYTIFLVLLNHCVAKSCDTLRKKIAFSYLLYFLKWFLGIDFLQISVVHLRVS